MKYLELEEILKGSPYLAEALMFRQDDIAALLVYAYNAGTVDGLAQAQRQLDKQ